MASNSIFSLSEDPSSHFSNFTPIRPKNDATPALPKEAELSSENQCVLFPFETSQADVDEIRFPRVQQNLKKFIHSPIIDMHPYDHSLTTEASSMSKKRRLQDDVVQSLEHSFLVDNRLEPERKAQLSRDLGIPPRQVAIWFQNRRVRHKTKQVEKNFENLKADNESLRSQNSHLLHKIQLLEEKLATRFEFETKVEDSLSSFSSEVNLDFFCAVKAEQVHEKIPMKIENDEGSFQLSEDCEATSSQTSPYLSHSLSASLHSFSTSSPMIDSKLQNSIEMERTSSISFSIDDNSLYTSAQPENGCISSGRMNDIPLSFQGDLSNHSRTSSTGYSEIVSLLYQWPSEHSSGAETRELEDPSQTESVPWWQWIEIQ